MASPKKNYYPAVVPDEEGLAGLRARGVTRALTVWPEWAMAGVKLRKFHDGVENRPYAFPPALKGRRIAIHAGRFIGGRQGGYAEGIAAVVSTACASGWKLYRPAENTLVFRRGSSTGLINGALVYEGSQEGDVTIRLPDDIVTSAIVMTAVLSGVIAPTPNPPRPWMVATEPDFDDEPSYGWVFSNIEILDKPIACKGLQRIWTV
jgi:hypothetical protein